MMRCQYFSRSYRAFYYAKDVSTDPREILYHQATRGFSFNWKHMTLLGNI